MGGSVPLLRPLVVAARPRYAHFLPGLQIWSTQVLAKPKPAFVLPGVRAAFSESAELFLRTCAAEPGGVSRTPRQLARTTGRPARTPFSDTRRINSGNARQQAADSLTLPSFCRARGAAVPHFTSWGLVCSKEFRSPFCHWFLFPQTPTPKMPEARYAVRSRILPARAFLPPKLWCSRLTFP